jgi:hypothetical protein
VCLVHSPDLEGTTITVRHGLSFKDSRPPEHSRSHHLFQSLSSGLDATKPAWNLGKQPFFVKFIFVPGRTRTAGCFGWSVRTRTKSHRRRIF